MLRLPWLQGVLHLPILPGKEATEQLLHFETTIQRNLFRKMHELERLQLRRKGESGFQRRRHAFRARWRRLMPRAIGWSCSKKKAGLFLFMDLRRKTSATPPKSSMLAATFCCHPVQDYAATVAH